MKSLRSIGFGIALAMVAVAAFSHNLIPARADAGGQHDAGPQLTGGVFAIGATSTTMTSTLLGPLVITDISGLGTILVFLVPAAASCDIGTTHPDFFDGIPPAPGPLLFYRVANNNSTISGARYLIPTGQRACIYATDGYPALGLAWSGFVP